MTRILVLVFHLGITFSPMVNDQEWCEQGKARDETGMEVHPYDVPCGGKFPLSGNLLSPVIPNEKFYPNYCKCRYLIGSDYAGQTAQFSFSLLHIDIESVNKKCVGDYLSISSSNGTTSLLPADNSKLCGSSILDYESLQNRVIQVKLPVVVYFHTDLDLKQHTGFEILYNTVPDAVDLGKVAKISSENVETEESNPAPVGLIVGLLIIILLAMSVIIFFLMKRNRKLKMESYVPTLELDDLGPTMAAPENIYEDLEVAQALIRTESQDSIAQAKAAAQIADRQLPPLPDN